MPSESTRLCACGCGKVVKGDYLYTKGHNPASYREPAPIAERFWSKVKKGDCWEFTGPFLPSGYGVFFISKRAKRPQMPAHRFSWELHHGPIPPGMKVCHKCDNPPCIRPDHLFLGTQQENLADMRAKGRAKPPPRVTHRGQATWNARLTEPQVLEIRRLAAQGLKATAVGRAIGVDRYLVRGVLEGRTWKHVA
jgi:hypothetical protein